MFNPAAGMKVAREVLTQNPKQLEEWAKRADSDADGVRQDIIRLAAEHGVKLSASGLKLALKAAKPFLGKLNDTNRAAAEKLISKLS